MIFNANGLGNCNIDIVTPSITDLNLTGYTGSIDVNGNTITVTGNATLHSGTITDGLATDSLVINTVAGDARFNGTTLDLIVNVITRRPYLSGSTFNERTKIEKSGVGDAVGTGNCIFNGETTLIFSCANN